MTQQVFLLTCENTYTFFKTQLSELIYSPLESCLQRHEGIALQLYLLEATFEGLTSARPGPGEGGCHHFVDQQFSQLINSRVV